MPEAPSVYAAAVNRMKSVIPVSALIRWGFNLSPMYRRSTGRLTRVSADMLEVDVQIPLTWRNSNYMGTMFGGSMLAATDPILMIQLIELLGPSFVVWDKAVQMRFRRPVRSKVSVAFRFTVEEVETLRERAMNDGEFDYEKRLDLFDARGDVVATATKTLYIATHEHYIAKRASRRAA